MLSAAARKQLSSIDRELIEQRVRAIWDCRAHGDIDGLLDYLAPDCVYVVTSWVGQPVTISREGREACGELARQIHILIEPRTAEVTELVVDGEQVAACRRVLVANRGTGRTAELDICYFMRFRDGLLVEMHERTDTLGMI